MDNVSIGNLQQVRACEPTRNTGLPGCAPSCSTSPDGTPCDDGDPCTTPDTCQSGACSGIPAPAPPEVDNGVAVGKSGSQANISWNVASGATSSDVLRGTLSGLPVGPGGGDETCFATAIPGNSISDSDPLPVGVGYWYVIRGKNACGNGTYGYRTQGAVPTIERVSTTCP